jgi:hypothetical protein
LRGPQAAGGDRPGLDEQPGVGEAELEAAHGFDVESLDRGLVDGQFDRGAPPQ